MRITQEADYAVRIIDCLARQKGRLDARSIAEMTGVTLRFTLKILRKLGLAGIVKSFKGVQGGYELAREPAEINMRQVIEAVDGPIVINRCLSGVLPCSQTESECGCYYHKIFSDVSKSIQVKFESINFEVKDPRKKE
jgi:Rrf2 family transcriptional regulator, iron-sulfur cluster assembly transcription factor